MRLRDTAEPLAGAALGAALGEPVTAVTSGIGLIKALLPTPDLRKRTEQLRERIEKLLPDGVEVSEAAVATAQEIVRSYVHPVDDLAACGDDPERAAALGLKRGRSLLRDFSDTETGEVRTLLVAYLGALRDDPSIVREVRARLQALTLEQVRAIAEGVDRQAAHADALQTLLARWIVRDVLYSPSVDSRRYRDDHDLGPAQLLNAAYEVVPFRGREAELDALRAFRDQTFAPVDVGTRVIEGEGGLGKTRLGMEAVQHARRDGWRAGFLDPKAEAETVRRGLAALDATGRPVFVVVDYGEDRPEQVATLIDAWLSTPSAHSRRLLLLVRYKGMFDQRLAQLKTENPRLRSAVDNLTSARVQPLTVSDLRVPPEERADVFREAQESFAARKGVRLDGLPAPPDTLGRETPAYRHLGLPLYLHMAALASLDGPPTVQKLDLLRVVLDRNWSYVQRLLDDDAGLDALHLTQDDLHDVLTVATLALAARPPTDEAPPDAAACLAPTPLGEEVRRRAARQLSAFLAGTFGVDGPYGKRTLDALRPDALGEGLVFDTLDREPALLDAALAMGPASRKSACTVLVRAALALADEPAAWIERLLPRERLQRDSELVFPLLLAIPEQIGSLSLLSSALATALADAILRGSWLAGENMDTLRARMLGYLGGRLWTAGDRVRCLALAEEAIPIWQRLAAREPDAFEPELANSLNNLATALSLMRRHNDALATTREAVAIWRRLNTHRPGIFDAELARALSQLGSHLAEVDQYSEALEAEEEATGIRERLAARDPEIFEPEFANSLLNLGIRLSEVGRYDEAIVISTRAVDLHRKLVAFVSDTYEANLATSLSNLGFRFSEIGDFGHAITVTEEAIELRRRLFKYAPYSIGPDLAKSLSNIGGYLLKLNRHDDAVAAEREAIVIRLRLAERNPVPFMPELAASFSSLGAMLLHTGSNDEAVETFRKATELYRHLAEHEPDAFEAEFASSLSNLSLAFSASGDHDDAINKAEESVEILMQLSIQALDAIEPRLAASLTNLGVVFSAAGLHGNAVASGERAFAVRRHIALRAPDSEPDLARSLYNLGGWLMKAGRPSEAVDAFAESLRLLTPFVQASPEAFRGLTEATLSYYLSACEAAKIEGNSALLIPIIRVIGISFGPGGGGSAAP